LGAFNGQKREKAEACAQIEPPVEVKFARPIRKKRLAGVRQGDLYGQVLRNRILRTVCGRYLRGIRDVVSFRKSKEFGIREFGGSGRRIFGVLQAEAMVDRRQAPVGKMISNPLKWHRDGPNGGVSQSGTYVQRYHWNFLA
jgi:hypothetical protein